MIENYYDEEFSLLESSKTNDGYGGKTETWTEVADSTFKGKKRLLSANERIADSANQYSEQWKIYCDISVNVTRHNMIKDSAGNEYSIIQEPENKWGHHLEIIVSK